MHLDLEIVNLLQNRKRLMRKIEKCAKTKTFCLKIVEFVNDLEWFGAKMKSMTSKASKNAMLLSLLTITPMISHHACGMSSVDATTSTLVNSSEDLELTAPSRETEMCTCARKLAKT